MAPIAVGSRFQRSHILIALSARVNRPLHFFAVVVTPMFSCQRRTESLSQNEHEFPRMIMAGPMPRRQSVGVNVGGVVVGGGAPVVVQSMTNTDTADIDATVRQVMQL